jgi:IclR family KDG regulon transcriptional repressor
MNSARNIMALIETLLSDGGEIGLRELSARTGVPKSTVQRFLAEMQENGWVAQDKRTQGYRIGYKLLSQSMGWTQRLKLVTQSRDILREVCSRSGQCVSLCTLDGYTGMVIGFSNSEKVTELGSAHPKTFPLYCTACGKLLLAYAPEPLRKYILYTAERKSYSDATITDTQTLQAELEKIRCNSYATSSGELLYGAAEIAVPMLYPDQTVMAVMGIVGRAESVEPKFGEYRALLVEGVRELQERLENL